MHALENIHIQCTRYLCLKMDYTYITAYSIGIGIGIGIGIDIDIENKCKSSRFDLTILTANRFLTKCTIKHTYIHKISMHPNKTIIGK